MCLSSQINNIAREANCVDIAAREFKSGSFDVQVNCEQSGFVEISRVFGETKRIFLWKRVIGQILKLDIDYMRVQVPQANMYTAARGHVQRVIDVAPLISNMSRMSTILNRRNDYDPIQVRLLDVAAGIVCQMLSFWMKN